MNEDEMLLLDDEDLAENTPVEANEPETGAEEQKPEVDQPKANEPQVPEDEDKKMLDYLNSKKLIKFNGENVDIKDFNDLATNYQKGLNYDKHEADEKVALDYVKEKASLLGISLKEYINRVVDYEKQKAQESQEQDIQKLVDNGVPESIAREVIETKLAREKFERKEAEYQKRIEEAEKKQKEDEEYLRFIDTHPGLKADEIPQEVFELSKDIGLNAAYNQYLVKKLEEENARLKQAQENVTSSPVSATSDGSTTNQMSKDPFWEGFDSE